MAPLRPSQVGIKSTGVGTMRVGMSLTK